MAKFMSRIVSAAVVVAMVVGVSGRATAGFITDPTGDFRPTFIGPHNGDLDVTSVDVRLEDSRFFLTATLAGAIGTTPGALYVWGVNRGAGTARFGAFAPGVLFDTVVLVRGDGTGSVGATNISSGIFINGDTITTRVDASLLPSKGFTPADYTFNLWPRLGVGNNNQISDFAPDNSNVDATVVPEPSTIAAAALGLLGGASLLLRRRHRDV